MPETTFDGEYIHPSLFEMAAAYLFHAEVSVFLRRHSQTR